MSVDLVGALAALALADSISLGTLLIPVLFLVAPRVRPSRILIYLATIGSFYFVVGGVAAWGVAQVPSSKAGLFTTPAVSAIQLVLGGAIVGGAIVALRRVGLERARSSESATAGRLAPSRRLARWRHAAVADPSGKQVVLIALGAGLIELATMVPYLAAIGMVSSSGAATGTRVALLAGYCALMVTPALLLLALRLTLRSKVETHLQRLASWMERTGAENTAWILIVVGGLLVRDALQRLQILEWLGGLFE
ncbi:GAP family protein [Microbacterium sp. NPDC089189]|uniref:GAP family protein n=1 Tax=Microbacterium sp. NPDC089189 TaxID=3154972 RepID=UPI00344AA19D